MNILEKIVAHKKLEVAKRKKRVSLKELERRSFFSRNCISLKESIKDRNKTGIIAEFKRRSPSKGIINDKVLPAEVAGGYAENGASGVSVLTDSLFFGGSNADLEEIRKIVQIPVLRKEFIIDAYQIIEAKAIGADVVLLISECLSKKEIKELAQRAASLGMEILLEMHSEEQLDKIVPPITLVGINNRDLATFKVNIDRSITLSRKLPDEMIKIAESGINDPAVIHKMKKAGFDGFLMGECFMKEANPAAAFRNFARKVDIEDKQ